MSRYFILALLACASFEAAACPLCLGVHHSIAHEMSDMPQAVLAVPHSGGRSYKVVAVIKGEPPANGTIAGDVVLRVDSVKGTAAPLILARDPSWRMWTTLGAIGAEHAPWLRRIASSIGDDDAAWRARAAEALPYLEHRDALVAEIAYDELASAPYAALLSLKPRLDVRTLRRWAADTRLAARQPLYVLLLGIAGDASDAAALERRLDAAWASGDASNLGALIAADLQMRGPSRMAWVDAKYLGDRKRSTREIEAALLALSAHGNANAVIPRARVIESYRLFMREHPEIAGYVAQDFAAWQYWAAVPDYAALMKSSVRQQYPSRVAITAYLRQSPNASP